MVEHHFNGQEFIQFLSDLISANIGNEDFGPKELACAAGISQRKLSHKLNVVLNKSVSRFICETRLKKALELLQTEDITASEAAYRVGFGSPTYFNKCFHEFFGFPPGQAKKGSLAEFDLQGHIDHASVTKANKPLMKIAGQAAVVLLFVAVLFLLPGQFLKRNYFDDATWAGTEATGRSIAVLPFTNLSDSAENQYFVDGLMDEILTDLSHISELRVTSRASVEQFRNCNKTAPEIAKKLRVAYLVTGSGQKYGDSYQLRVQLTEAKTDRQLWARTYEKELRTTRDIYETQGQIARSIASELKVSITPGEKNLIERNKTESLTAYYYYLKGNEELSRSWYPDYNPENLKKAFIFYHKALESDTTFSLAYNGLAEIYWQKYDRDRTIKDYRIINRYRDSSLILSDIALSYDPYLTLAYNNRAGYYGSLGNIKRALEENDKALNCNPNDWFSNYQRGDLFSTLDIVKSIEQHIKGLRLAMGPELPQSLSGLGHFFYQAGFPEVGSQYFLDVFKLDGDSVRYRHRLAMEEASQGNFLKAIELREKDSVKFYTEEWGLGNKGICYLFLGQYDEALKYFEHYVTESVAGNISIAPLYQYIAFAWWQNGNKQLGDTYIKKALEDCDCRSRAALPADNYALARVYACLGNKEKEYENLRIYCQNGSVTIAYLTCLKKDPLFNNIRNEERFRRIYEDVEARYLANHERVRKWLEENGGLK